MTANFVSSVSGSAVNGGSVTLTFGAANVGDVVYVAYATTTLKTMVVTSSSGGAYTTLLTTGNGTGSVLSFGVHRFVQPSPVSLQALCSGTGTVTDATAAVGMIFRFASTGTPEDVTTTSTNGTSTTPDSPSITPATVDDIILTLFGIFNNTQGTAPSSFRNSIQASTTDTRSCGCGMAWLTNGSTSAFNPASWTGFTSATWCSATVAIRSTVVWDEMGVISDKEVVIEKQTKRVRNY
jgi:hypothetical protein